MAARIVDPVAIPSSTRMTVRPWTWSGTVAAIGPLPAPQFLDFPLGDIPDRVSPDVQCLDHVVVEHPGPSRSDGAHGQLFVAGHPQLADHADVERHAERPRNFEGNRHTPARQSRHPGRPPGRRRHRASRPANDPPHYGLGIELAS